MRPSVSVIMAARNEEQRVGRAIASVLCQTFHDWELVVVDDCSQDRTREVLDSFASRDARVHVLSSSVQLGRAAARNLAIEHAHADLVAILDADDMMMPSRLERQITFMAAHPDVGMLGAGAYYVLAPSGQVKTLLMPTDDTAIRRGFDRGIMPFIHVTMVFRREQIVAHGGYQRVTAQYNEDYYLCARLIRVTKAAALPEPLVVYACEGLTDEHRLRGKHREMIEIESRLLREKPSVQRSSHLAGRKLAFALLPGRLETALMHMRLRRLPMITPGEQERLTAWLAHLDRCCAQVAHPDEGASGL